jgi:hypothetical protein
MRGVYVYVLCVVVCLVTVPGVAGVELSPEEASSRDVFVYEFLPTLNFNSGGYEAFLGTSKTSSGHDVRSMIAFDLSGVALPASGVAAAELRLYVTDSANFGLDQPNASAAAPIEVAAYPLAEAWDEGSVTWLTQPAAEATASDTITVDGFDYWVAWDVTEVVRSWLAGTRVNDGLKVVALNEGIDPDTGKRVAVFYEGAAGVNRPMLVIESYPGDFDEDGDVDLGDYGVFLGCYTGPGNAAAPECAIADFDEDGDVDLTDYGTFLDCYGGPGVAPACAP